MRARCLPFVSLVAVGVGCSGDPAVPAMPAIEDFTPIEDTNPDPHIVEVNLTASATTAEIRPLLQTEVLAYNGTLPGPLLEARVGDRIIVHFQNDLAEATTIHWHGLRISPDMDGDPHAQGPVPPGGSFTYDFVLPDPGTYWFHPHMGTIEQIDRGLYGAIIVTEAERPVFTAERLFVVDDMRILSDGQIAPYNYSGHDVMMGRIGNVMLTNGKASTVHQDGHARAIERWRIINAATARVFELAVDGASWRVIATDGGLLPTPYQTERLLVAPGQRFELEVTYDLGVDTARLLSYNLYVSGTPPPPVEMAIVHIAGYVSPKPPVYPAIALPALTDAAEDREIRLGATNEGFTINGAVADAIPTLEFSQGTPVRLTVKNEIGPYHPFHLHGQFFQILTRDGKPVDEPGLKDTVLLDAFETVTLLTYFENPGMWMYHCHIPEHAELGMMAHLMVHPTDGSSGGGHQGH